MKKRTAARAATLYLIVLGLGLLAGRAQGTPWSGGPTGFDRPDPLSFWLWFPLASYLWAIVLAKMVADMVSHS